MKLLQRLSAAWRSFSLSEPPRDPVLREMFGIQKAASGISVTETTALNYSAFWAAVHLISGHMGALPLTLYERGADNRSRQRAYGHPTYRLLHDEFNDHMTATVGRRTMAAHTLTWGNGYAEIERTNNGRPVAIWPLSPSQVTPKWEKAKGSTARYTVRYEVRGQPTLEYMDVLHVPGLSFDGLKGYSVVKQAREGIGLGLATERFGAAFFGNGARPGVALKHPKTLSKDAQDRLKASFWAEHGGPDRAGGVHVLEEGMDLSTFSIPNDDAQFLETRKFGVDEMARWFNMPPHKLASMDRATFSNIEHQAIEYLTDCLYPRLVTVEQEVARKLLTPEERGRFFAEHVVDGLLRGDVKARYDAYAVGRQWGWLSADEVREKENMNPLPDEKGTVYLAPSNMTTPEKLAAAPPPGMGKPAPPRNPEADRALRWLLVDALRRLVRKEANAARRAATKGPADFTAWLEEFYGGHEAQLVEILEPCAPTHAKTRAGQHVTDSRAALQEARANRLEEDVERIVSRWEIERPVALADALLGQEENDEYPKAS